MHVDPEHRGLRRSSWLLAAGVLAAVSCSRASSLGISADINEVPPHASLTSVAFALKPTTISGTDDDILTLERASIDLFYGRTDFPEQLTTQDADAAFEGGLRQTVALGDINCDGLADFAIGHMDG